MKKTISIFAVAALLFATAVSCERESLVPVENDPEEHLADDGAEAVPGGMVRLSFAVSTERDSGEADTRTSWDGTELSWSESDEIRILWGEGAEDYRDVEVAGGKVTLELAAETLDNIDDFYAVYPPSADYTFSASAGTLSVRIGREQSGEFKDANIMAAKTAKSELALHFKNMTSIVKFSTAAATDFTRITLGPNSLEKTLTGTIDTDFPETFAVTPGGTGEYVSLSGIAAGQTYYLAILPGEDIGDGIAFKVEKDGKPMAGGLGKSAFERARATVYDLGEINSRIVSDWYITTDGTGNGTSEAAPAGPERLIDLLAPSYSRNGTTAGWRLTGATIHVAGGTYNIQEANGGATLAPHYNASGISVYVKGEGNGSNPTTFICNQTADTDHIFEVGGSNKVVDFTFENITFTANPSATETATSGIAFSYTSSANSVVTFKDCTFDGLTSTSATGTYGGAAVYVSGDTPHTIVFEDCTFSNNTAARGGAVALSNTDTGSAVSFNGCTFSGNMAVAASSNQGGAIYMYAKSSAFFDHTSFEGDGSTSQALNGAGIAIMAGASATFQNGCSFSRLVTGGNGGALFNHGNLTVCDATFSSCKARRGGAIYTDGTALIFNSLLLSNIATDNTSTSPTQYGGILFSGGTGNTVIANSTASKNTTPSSNSTFVTNGANTKLYVVSCTMAENTNDITRTSATIQVHNSILMGGGDNLLNVIREKSIWNRWYYGEMGGSRSTTQYEAFDLGTFNGEVYPLDSRYEDIYTQGMTAAELKAIDFGNISLTDPQKNLLGKDQKGNERNGRIMGAYVLTE